MRGRCERKWPLGKRNETRPKLLWIGASKPQTHEKNSSGVTHHNLFVGALAHNAVIRILQDRNGDIWVTTATAGITRYRPRHTPPPILLKDVVADRRYGPIPEIHLSASQKLLAFEFQGRSFTTRPDQMAYVVRLEGYDPDWKPIYTGRVEYHDLPLGEYVFQVKAVDRDLNYSEPVTVHITVEPDPRLEAFAAALSGTSEEFVGDSDSLRRVEEQLTDAAPCVG